MRNNTVSQEESGMGSITLWSPRQISQGGGGGGVFLNQRSAMTSISAWPDKHSGWTQGDQTGEIHGGHTKYRSQTSTQIHHGRFILHYTDTTEDLSAFSTSQHDMTCVKCYVLLYRYVYISVSVNKTQNHDFFMEMPDLRINAV